jgi:hypothetical protein
VNVALMLRKLPALSEYTFCPRVRSQRNIADAKAATPTIKPPDFL